MGNVPSVVGSWSALGRTVTFAADGTFTFSHPSGVPSTGTYTLSYQHPDPTRPKIWPLPATGLFLRFDQDMPPGALPFWTAWSVDELSNDRLAVRYSKPVRPGEFTIQRVELRRVQ